MDIQWPFQFQCLNEWQCTYVCSVHEDGTEPTYTSCQGSFLASNLQNGVNYEFSVIATDGVGNVGLELTYQWEVGKLQLSLLIYCGTWCVRDIGL